MYVVGPQIVVPREKHKATVESEVNTYVEENSRTRFLSA